MYSSFSVDFRDEDHRPFLAQPGRHRAPEAEVKPVAPPAWAPDERARPIRVPGEETVKMPFSEPVGDELTGLRLPSRAHGAALQALMMPAPRPKPSLLGQCLHALRSWWSQ
jgi:hypothetical protein